MPLRKSQMVKGSKGRTSNSHGFGKHEVQAIPDFSEPMYEIVAEVVWQVGREIIEIHEDATNFILKNPRKNVLTISKLNRIEINKFKMRNAFTLVGAHNKKNFDKMIENMEENSYSTSKSVGATPTDDSNFDGKNTGSETLSEPIGLDKDFGSSLGEFDLELIDREMCSYKKFNFSSRLLKQESAAGIIAEDEPVLVITPSKIGTPSKKNNPLGGMTAGYNRKSNTPENPNLFPGEILEVSQENSGFLGSRRQVSKKDKFGIKAGKISLKKSSQQIVVPPSEPDPVAQPEVSRKNLTKDLPMLRFAAIKEFIENSVDFGSSNFHAGIMETQIQELLQSNPEVFRDRNDFIGLFQMEA